MELLQYIILICTLYFVEAKFLHLHYQYDEDAKVWLKLHKIKTGWHQARKTCNMEGAILASPLDEPLKDALDNFSKAYGIDRFYVGIHATFSSQIWHSIEGISIENLEDHLNVSQMDNSGYRSCAVMEDGSLINVGCEEKFPYICYKKDNVSMELTACETTDRAYQLDKRTGNCYKFHAEARTWVEAYETCFAEQAYLAIINSYAEAQILTDIFAQHPSNTIHADHPNVMNIGIIDWEHNREWYTIHGERLQDSGYSSWNRGEPNNADNNEYCGSIHRNGFLNDEPCLKRNVFMCEKDIKFVSKESTTENVYTTESEPTENLNTADSETTENLYTTESEPVENQYTTDSEPVENQYTTDSEPVENQYTTDLEPIENQYTTDSEPVENQYTTDSEPVENQYTTDLEPLENQYTTDSEPVENQYTTDSEPVENQYTIDLETIQNQYTTDSEPIENQYTTDSEPIENQDTTESEPVENLYTTESEPIIFDFSNLPQ